MVDILGLATALRAATTIIKFVFVFVGMQQDTEQACCAWVLCGAASHSITIFAPAALDPQISHPWVLCTTPEMYTY
jgi:hypothetical protein